ncbi:MAG: hypothetical protein ACPGUC_02655, partial [Gammaproteobacteria bacterium]
MIPFPKATREAASAGAVSLGVAAAVFACIGVAIAQQDGFGPTYGGGQYRPAEPRGYSMPEPGAESSAPYAGGYPGQANPYVYRPVDPDPPLADEVEPPAPPSPSWDEGGGGTAGAADGGGDWYSTDRPGSDVYPGM